MSVRALLYVIGKVRGLEKAERLVLLSIADHMNNGSDVAWPGVDKIADQMELNRGTVLRAIKALESKGKIGIERSPGNRKSHRYTIVGLSENPQSRSATVAQCDGGAAHVHSRAAPSHGGAARPEPVITSKEPEEGAAIAAHRPRRLKATIESEEESPFVLPSLCPDDQALVAEIAEAFGKEAVSIQLIESIVRRCGHRKVRFAFERTLQSDKQLRGSRAVSYMAGIAGRLRTDELNVPAKKADGPNAGFAEAFSLATYGTRFPNRNAQ